MQPERPRWESPVEKAIREAQERGEFDDLPGAGKPLTDLGDPDDPLWWVRRKAEREQLDLSLALPPGLQLRKEAVELEWEGEAYLIVPHAALLALARPTHPEDLPGFG